MYIYNIKQYSKRGNFKKKNKKHKYIPKFIADHLFNVIKQNECECDKLWVYKVKTNWI